MSCRQMEVQVWKSREIRTRENGMGDINAGAIVETLHRNKSERREATGRSSETVHHGTEREEMVQEAEKDKRRKMKRK